MQTCIPNLGVLGVSVLFAWGYGLCRESCVYFIFSIPVSLKTEFQATLRAVVQPSHSSSPLMPVRFQNSSAAAEEEACAQVPETAAAGKEHVRKVTDAVPAVEPQCRRGGHRLRRPGRLPGEEESDWHLL